MKKDLTLLLDCNYLCHRAYHSMPRNLSHDGIATSVLFGFARELTHLVEKFAPSELMFCFDAPNSKRRQLYPEYKGNRKARSPEEETAAEQVHAQINMLRDSELYACGFSNVWHVEGFEADDCLAWGALSASARGRDSIVVTADEDLYQCLSTERGIKIWQPNKKRIISERVFAEEHEMLSPREWVLVKSLAGCSSDNIKGMKGVGTKTAVKWFAGLPLSDAKKVALRAWCRGEQFKLNKRLVTLPFIPLNEAEAAGCSFIPAVQEDVESTIHNMLHRLSVTWGIQTEGFASAGGESSTKQRSPQEKRAMAAKQRHNTGFNL